MTANSITTPTSQSSPITTLSPTAPSTNLPYRNVLAAPSLHYTHISMDTPFPCHLHRIHNVPVGSAPSADCVGDNDGDGVPVTDCVAPVDEEEDTLPPFTTEHCAPGNTLNFLNRHPLNSPASATSASQYCVQFSWTLTFAKRQPPPKCHKRAQERYLSAISTALCYIDVGRGAPVDLAHHPRHARRLQRRRGVELAWECSRNGEGRGEGCACECWGRCSHCRKIVS